MFGQPKWFFALAALLIDVPYNDGNIGEIRLAVRNLAIVGAIPLVVDMAVSLSVGQCSPKRRCSPGESEIAVWAMTDMTAPGPLTTAQIYLLPATLLLRSGNHPCYAEDAW